MPCDGDFAIVRICHAGRALGWCAKGRLDCFSSKARPFNRSADCLLSLSLGITNARKKPADASLIGLRSNYADGKRLYRLEVNAKGRGPNIAACFATGG